MRPCSVVKRCISHLYDRMCLLWQPVRFHRASSLDLFWFVPVCFPWAKCTSNLPFNCCAAALSSEEKRKKCIWGAAGKTNIYSYFTTLAFTPNPSQKYGDPKLSFFHFVCLLTPNVHLCSCCLIEMKKQVIYIYIIFIFGLKLAPAVP